jgi:hypothetical protein
MSDSTTSTTTITQEDTEPPPVADIYWNSVLDAPTSTMASQFNAPTVEHLKDVENMASFLLQESRILDNLNMDKSLVPFVINIPNNKRQLRIIYGIGTGCGLNGLGSNPLENSIIALTGELLQGVSIPATLVLPEETLDLQEISIPSDKQIEPHLITRNTKTSWFKAADCDDTANIPSICPIPAFLLKSSFAQDIDVMELFEKARALTEAQKELIPNTLSILRPFLKASVVKYKISENSIHQEPLTFMQQSTPHEAKWKQQRMKQLFPTLSTTSTSPAQPAQNTEWTADKLIALANAGLTQRTPTEEKKSDSDTEDTPSTLGLSTTAYNKLLRMCGIAAGQEDEIPDLWTQLNEKNLTKIDKQAIAAKALLTTVQWRDAKVKPLAPILKMIVERSFEGETSLASLYAAAKGLTPFAVPCLTEAEAYTLNELAEAMASASSTTIKDITGAKMKATVPTTFDKMLKRIKRFGNLLIAVFGEGCPLFFHTDHIITDLDDYSETARAALSPTSIASIIWILHLQSRHFASGLMTINSEGEETLLPEFTYMCNAIKAKQQVYHGEVPAALLHTPEPPKDKRPQPTPTDPNKKPRTEEKDKWIVAPRPDTYHPLIKKAMEPIMQLQRQPSVQKLCRAAGCHAGQLFPHRKKLCIRAQLFGKCFTSCQHEHSLISDEEAEKSLKHLTRFLSDPQQIKKVNNY